MEKKGGDSFGFPRKFLFISLFALVFMSIIFWDRDQNPLISTQESAQNLYTTPSTASACFLQDPNNSSVSTEPEIKTNEENSQSMTTIEQREEASENVDGNKNETALVQTKDCNYANGRWVADSRRPFYSGFQCKQWLRRSWACRLTQREDFSYEGYRWQPKNCEMPEFERFSFLKKMQNKTIAFIGDSLGRQQFQSLMCMASGGEKNPEVKDVSTEYGLGTLPGAKRPPSGVYRFLNSNTTILYYWSTTLCHLEPINSKGRTSYIAMHLDHPVAFLRRYLHRFDVLVLNTGHHWKEAKFKRNRWVMHLNGKPNESTQLGNIRNALNFTTHSIVRWLDSQLPTHAHLKAFFRTISPSQSDTCNNTIPLTRGSEVLQDESGDKVIESAVKGSRVKILDITAISELRDEAYISSYSSQGAVNDCLHWCLPGVPDTWNELLIAQI